VSRRTLRFALAGGLLVGLGLADGLWLEPRVLLREDLVRIGLPAPGLRAVHLSDLHISEDRPLLHRLLERISDAKPDLILISGDFIRDVPQPADMGPHIAATAAFISELRRIAPVIGVQGHSEHQGDVIAALDRAGVELLSNEGRRIGRGGRLLLLGLNQQAGTDALVFTWPNPFRIVRWKGEPFYGARRGEPFRNFYSHWDPAPLGLTDEGGPLSWSGYDTVCDVLIDDREAGAGLVAHSRFVLGEDRLYSLTRARPEHGLPGSFRIWSRGTPMNGKDDLDTGVVPEPGRWYRMRLRTEVEEGLVRVLARVWPADGPEPREWQARAEDRSKHRIERGTAGLWAWGGGTVIYRHLRVTGPEGQVLLDAPLTGPAKPKGFREGTRGTRLALALARSPYVPPGTPTVVLSHTPSVAVEAARRGIEVVLAGHTHGGQIRLPFFGALTTRDALGAYYDYGRFHLASPNPRGMTTLYINAGIGTSVLPIRFWCPPRFAVVELGRGEGRCPGNCTPANGL
jgi:predicted MPP superfamily phosphohydrolase